MITITYIDIMLCHIRLVDTHNIRQMSSTILELIFLVLDQLVVLSCPLKVHLHGGRYLATLLSAWLIEHLLVSCWFIRNLDHVIEVGFAKSRIRGHPRVVGAQWDGGEAILYATMYELGVGEILAGDRRGVHQTFGAAHQMFDIADQEDISIHFTNLR